MPISPIVLQRRHAEQGRIRLGGKRDGSGAPMKLESFRFTSTSEQHIKDLAELYGGEPRAWDNGGKPEFEVYTEAKAIPVIAVKGGLSQWMETWSGGGCTHRCDGEINVLTDTPCNPNDPAHKNAKPTTRLSLMLAELDSLGVWRLESHGWNAAAEIPAIAELAQFVGDLVPARLHLVERRAVKDGKSSRFVVPVLDLQIGTARLRELVNEKSGATKVLETSTTPPPRPELQAAQPNYREQAVAAADLEEIRVIWQAAVGAGHLDDDLRAFLTERGNAFHAPAAEAPTRAGDGVVEAELVTDDDGDAVWQQVLKVAGSLPTPMGLSEVTEDFSIQMGGLIPDDASAAELRVYLDKLTSERAA